MRLRVRPFLLPLRLLFVQLLPQLRLVLRALRQFGFQRPLQRRQLASLGHGHLGFGHCLIARPAGFRQLGGHPFPFLGLDVDAFLGCFLIPSPLLRLARVRIQLFLQASLNGGQLRLALFRLAEHAAFDLKLGRNPRQLSGLGLELLHQCLHGTLQLSDRGLGGSQILVFGFQLDLFAGNHRHLRLELRLLFVQLLPQLRLVLRALGQILLQRVPQRGQLAGFRFRGLCSGRGRVAGAGGFRQLCQHVFSLPGFCLK